jgi:hypothetical protein
MSRLVLLLITASLAACAPSVEDLCERLDDECPNGDTIDYDNCTKDGERKLQAADDAGCSEPFDVYFDCVDDAGCGWPTACDELRRDLDACIGQE